MDPSCIVPDVCGGLHKWPSCWINDQDNLSKYHIGQHSIFARMQRWPISLFQLSFWTILFWVMQLPAIEHSYVPTNARWQARDPDSLFLILVVLAKNMCLCKQWSWTKDNSHKKKKTIFDNGIFQQVLLVKRCRQRLQFLNTVYVIIL